MIFIVFFYFLAIMFRYLDVPKKGTHKQSEMNRPKGDPSTTFWESGILQLHVSWQSIDVDKEKKRKEKTEKKRETKILEMKRKEDLE
jgi:hypothetical protein